MHFHKENCKIKLLSVAGLFVELFVVKMHFKDAKEAAQRRDAFSTFIHQSKTNFVL